MPFYLKFQIRLRVGQHQMIMIAHDHIGMDAPASLPAGLQEDPEKSLPVYPMGKQVLAVIPAVQHMVKRFPNCSLPAPSPTVKRLTRRQ